MSYGFRRAQFLALRMDDASFQCTTYVIVLILLSARFYLLYMLLLDVTLLRPCSVLVSALISKSEKTDPVILLICQALPTVILINLYMLLENSFPDSMIKRKNSKLGM